jgi:very-short-patch-repair endonuclease
LKKGDRGGFALLPYSKNLKEPARNLRKEMTDAERTLWTFLRGKKILGIQFYRQKPIGPYIVDFYAPATKLVIEADGSQHLEPEHVKMDEVRDAFLAEQGLLVLRFDNGTILKQTDSVLEKVYHICRGRLEIPPGPPLPKGGDISGVV